MEFLFPEYRLSWFDAGPSSPNKTGALLACWVVACLWPMLRVRAWWGVVLSFLLMSVGLMFMLQTGSRGALVGVLAGVAVIAASVLLFTKVEQRNKDLSVASHRLLGWALGLVLLVIAVGPWLCGQTSRDLGVHDHGGIVWDEFAGLLVTFIPLALVGAAPTVAVAVAGFVLFRIFDVLKPWPIGWLDRRVHGGTGIMVDDLLAGVYAGVLLYIALPWLV